MGRLPVYHFFNIFFIIFTAITGFSNSVGMIVAFRFLTGMATTACLNSSVVGDMYAVKGRGAAMSIMSLMPLVGTAIGPILGGYVTQHLSWRWTFWLTAILTGAVELGMIVVYRETYLPHILRRRERATADLTDSAADDVPVKPTLPIYMWPMAVLRFLLQPFVILFGSRAATIIALYLSIIYAYLFLLAATMATVFQEVYGFSETSSGLVFLGQSKSSLLDDYLSRLYPHFPVS
jgi:MFS family permease